MTVFVFRSACSRSDVTSIRLPEPVAAQSTASFIRMNDHALLRQTKSLDGLAGFSRPAGNAMGDLPICRRRGMPLRPVQPRGIPTINL